MRELDRKEGRMSKNWCLWVVLEKAPEIPLDSKAIKSVSLKGKQPWIVIERADTEAETPVFWLSDANSWLIGKVPDAGKDRGLKEKRASEDEMAGWHHWLDGHECEWTPGVGDGQGGLACCDSWGHKELDTTERLNWTENKQKFEKSTDSTSLLSIHFLSGSCWTELSKT